MSAVEAEREPGSRVKLDEKALAELGRDVRVAKPPAARDRATRAGPQVPMRGRWRDRHRSMMANAAYWAINDRLPGTGAARGVPLERRGSAPPFQQGLEAADVRR